MNNIVTADCIMHLHANISQEYSLCTICTLCTLCGIYIHENSVLNSSCEMVSCISVFWNNFELAKDCFKIIIFTMLNKCNHYLKFVLNNINLVVSVGTTNFQ